MSKSSFVSPHALRVDAVRIQVEIPGGVPWVLFAREDVVAESPMLRTRPDILAKHHQRLKEEAPYAYKPITPVIETFEDAGVARSVARLWPVGTVKG